MKLRKMTSAGMMDCKKALEEANGDFDKAVGIIREKGKMVAAKRADRETAEFESTEARLSSLPLDVRPTSSPALPISRLLQTPSRTSLSPRPPLMSRLSRPARWQTVTP